MEILDPIGPLTISSVKPKTQPWLNNVTRSLLNNQKAVRAAETKYCSKIMSNICQGPHISFSVINSALNPPTAAPLVASLSLRRKTDCDTKKISRSSKGRLNNNIICFRSTKQTQTDMNDQQLQKCLELLHKVVTGDTVSNVS